MFVIKGLSGFAVGYKAKGFEAEQVAWQRYSLVCVRWRGNYSAAATA